MNREPALIIGFIGAALLAIVQTFAGSGIVSPDTGQTIINLAGALVPLMTGFLIRFFVSPATAPGF